MNKIASIIATLAIAAIIGFQFKSRVNLPQHLLGHPSVMIKDLLSPQDADQLLKILKEMKTLPSNAATPTAYTPLHEHIGEAEPITASGSCTNSFLVPNKNRTHCIFPGRIDVGRHYILSGGVEGLKEGYGSLVSRLQSFGRYMFNLTQYPFVEKLFKEEKFLQAAKTICPASKPVLDPFQFNFIIQVPGQSVAIHLDSPVFHGATRFQFPEYLLAAMAYSGLFTDRFIDQVQVVAYFHKWEANETRKGEFIYWDENIPAFKTIKPVPLSGTAVDGSKTVHAASVYGSDYAPVLDKNKENILAYDGKGEDWTLRSDGEVVKRYKTDDLRMTIVYRARCFASEAERKKFANPPKKDMLTLDSVLETFRLDLVKRGKRGADEPIEPMFAFALQIMDTYITYPLSPSAFIPFNYCALSRLVPQADAVLQYICS